MKPLAMRTILLLTCLLLLLAAWPASAAPKKDPAAVDKELETTRVETLLRRLADKLAVGFKDLPGDSKYQRLAVMKFTTSGERSKDYEMGTLVTAVLTNYFVGDHGVQLVERERLNDVLDELARQELLSDSYEKGDGLRDEEALELGKLVDAQALLVGNVADAGDHFTVTARLVSVATGVALLSQTAVLPADDLVALSKDAVVLRTKVGAMWRSMIIPGWGQYYNKKYIQSGVFFGSVLALGAASITVHVLGERDMSRYNHDVRDTVKYKDRADKEFLARDIMLGIMGAVWLANILEAYLNGTDFDQDQAFVYNGPTPPWNTGKRNGGGLAAASPATFQFTGAGIHLTW